MLTTPVPFKAADVTLNGAGDLIISPGGSADMATETTLAKLPGLSVGEHDYISLGYTGSNLTTVTYKTGGAGGTTVATLTLGYDVDSNLTSVTKT